MPYETRSDDTRPKQTRAALSQKCKLQFQALPTQSPETTAAGTSVSLIDLIRERELIEESIKDLNNEEIDAVEIDSELDKVLEKIKNLISTPPQSQTPHESTWEHLALPIMRRQLSTDPDDSCEHISDAFTQLEREEETREKLILIQLILNTGTIGCSQGLEEGCKIFVSMPFYS